MVWQTALEVKDRCIRTTRHKMFRDSLREYFDGVPFRSATQIRTPSSLLALKVQDALIRRLQESEIIYLSGEVVDHLHRTLGNGSYTTHPKEFISPEIKLYGDKLYETVEDAVSRKFRMSSIHCPTPETMPMPLGLLCPPSGMVLQAGPGAPAEKVRAIGFDTTSLLQGIQATKSVPGLAVYVFMDSVYRTKWAPAGLYHCIIPRWWMKNETLYDLAMELHYSEKPSEYQFQVSNNMLALWAYEFVLAFFKYTSVSIAHHPQSVDLSSAERKLAYKLKLRPTMKFVYWRKIEPAVPVDHEPKIIDWSCQWPVREHIRRYKSGKVVTIKSYTKGPKDKPMRETGVVLHKAVRL